MNFPNRIIKEGETNQKIVKAVQEKLNAMGSGPLEVTGSFDSKTKASVKLFQSTHRDQNGNPLEIDGKIGAITWAVLFGPDEVPQVTDAPNELLTKAVSFALTQVGVMEQPPGSNKGPEVNKYLASVDQPPGVFWCAGFVYFCFNEAAKSLGRTNPLVKTAGCLDHWNRTKAKTVLSADAVNKPSLLKPGQIFIIDNGGGHGHTGILESVDGGFIHTLEGNSNTNGSSNGIGVFQVTRKIVKINKGFIEYK